MRTDFLPGFSQICSSLNSIQQTVSKKASGLGRSISAIFTFESEMNRATRDGKHVHNKQTDTYTLEYKDKVYRANLSALEKFVEKRVARPFLQLVLSDASTKPKVDLNQKTDTAV